MRTLQLVFVAGALAIPAAACGFEDPLGADDVESSLDETQEIAVVATGARVAPSASARPLAEPTTPAEPASLAVEPRGATIDAPAPQALSLTTGIEATNEPVDLVADRSTFHAKLIETLVALDARLLAAKRGLASLDDGAKDRVEPLLGDVTTARLDVDKEQTELALIPNGAWPEAKTRITLKLRALDAALLRLEASLGLPSDGPSEI